ncbi:hypothetical protein BH11BAC2_BH11BAC2_11990 [soil metagenome]
MKICEMCKNMFNCTTENITSCQCSAVQISLEESNFIKEKYSDCLCLGCLKELKVDYQTKNKYLNSTKPLH